MSIDLTIEEQLETMRVITNSLAFATNFGELVVDLSEWSQETFGSDDERGPIGPLKHLEKEAREAQLNPKSSEEYADCLIILLDAVRRAGFTPMQLVEAALDKMEQNKERRWVKPPPGDEDPCEHIKEVSHATVAPQQAPPGGDETSTGG